MSSRFARFVAGATVVGHNVAFDLGLIAAETRRAGLPALRVSAVRHARRRLAALPRVRPSCARRAGGGARCRAPAHRALPTPRPRRPLRRALPARRRSCATRAALAGRERSRGRHLPCSISQGPAGAGAAAARRRDAAGGPGRWRPPRRLRLARRARGGDPGGPRLRRGAGPGWSSRRLSPPPWADRARRGGRPLFSTLAAWASSKPAPVWARASPICCRRRTTVHPAARA